MWIVAVILTYVFHSFVVPTSVVQAVRIQDHKNFHLLPKDCGVSYSDRIIGGDIAQLGQYPWLARLGYTLPGCSNKTTYRCGGALINSRYVLTAAHCSADLPEIQCPKTDADVTFELTRVVLGEYNVTTDPDCIDGVCAAPIQTIDIEKIIIHQSYNTPEYANDISLLRLKAAAVLNGWVSPICLPHGKQLQKLYTNNRLEVAGWGATNATKQTASKVLMFVKIPSIPLSRCLRSFSINLTLSPELQMCAGGEKDKDSCNGDSGGPLMLVDATDGPPKYSAIGLVSFGIKHCGKKDKPAVYTRMAGYMKWILDSIQE